LHVLPARIGQNAAAAQCPRPELHAPVKPAHNFPFGQQSGDMAAQRLFVGKMAVNGTLRVEHCPYVLGAETWTEQRAALAIASFRLSPISEQLVPDQQRHAQCAAGIACRRLNPDLPERPLAQ